MQRFLFDNRDELIARCTAKVARRHGRAATPGQLANGIPLFLNQLMCTLQAEQEGRVGDSIRLSGTSSGDASAPSEMGISAAAHGAQLLQLGFSVDQVVHDYGDLCQAITDLAFERKLPVSVDNFRTLNRCLDNAIADAVLQFSTGRDVTVRKQLDDKANESLGMLLHELRNLVHSTTLALTALESGSLPLGGATGSMLKRGLAGMASLLNESLEGVRVAANGAGTGAGRGGDGHGHDGRGRPFSLAAFIADANGVARLDAEARHCSLAAAAVDPLLAIAGHRDKLMAALVNLLQNAFKFTQAHTKVTLHAHAVGNRVLIDVEDRCGGLPNGFIDHSFKPFSQESSDRSGLGLGLAIARRSIAADGGTLGVRDLPGVGCVFSISLPKHLLA